MQRLSAQGLKCTLTNHLLHAKPGSSVQLLKHQLMAFPWAIVEVKPEDVPDARETFCFNQAANATAAAIRMYKRLTDACPGSEGRDIPAVIAFTCVGPRVKVWLAYFDDRTFATVSA